MDHRWFGPSLACLLLAGSLLALPAQTEPKQLGKSPTGLKPLSEMTAQDKYKGEEGGLYGGGKNEPPAGHLAAAQKETARIVPLDAEGKPAGDGKIVLIAISMSNVEQEFGVFKATADADPRKSPRVIVVNTAQGGRGMGQWAQPRYQTWEEAEERLRKAGVTPQQVQVAWVKPNIELLGGRPLGGTELSEYTKKVQADTRTVLQTARTRFPNLRIVYLASRTYGGYATTDLNPEPYAYESAFVVRMLIRDQIKGDASLNHDAARGPVKVPLLLWGPYLWADGATPRQGDGLVWERQDMGRDGTHPSKAGEKKVTDLLLGFFKTDALAKTWFVKP